MQLPASFAGLKKPSALPVIPQSRRDSAALVVSMSKLAAPGRAHSISLQHKKSISMSVQQNYGAADCSSESAREQAFLLSDPAHGQSLHSEGSLARPGELNRLFNNSNSSLNSGSSILSGSTQSVAEEKDSLLLATAPGDQAKHPIASASEPPKILVDCVVVLLEAQVIVGACSDRHMRFWDLATHDVLCSCCYYHRLESHDGHDKHAWPPPSSSPPQQQLPSASRPPQRPPAGRARRREAPRGRAPWQDRSAACAFASCGGGARRRGAAPPDAQRLGGPANR